MILQELRDWHMTQRERLLESARRELRRRPMRVSIDACDRWLAQSDFHLVAADLIELTINEG